VTLFWQAIARLNFDLPPEVIEDAYRKLAKIDAPTPSNLPSSFSSFSASGGTPSISIRLKSRSTAMLPADVVNDFRVDRIDNEALQQLFGSSGNRVGGFGGS
jgi:hypothetical protein